MIPLFFCHKPLMIKSGESPCIFSMFSNKNIKYNIYFSKTSLK